jgi:hypothetical protein
MGEHQMNPQDHLSTAVHRTSSAILVGASFVLSVTTWQFAQADDRLEYWMKAFIPNVHPTNPDLIAQVPGHPNRWMLKGPLPNGICFETDDRGFSNDRNAKAKVTTHFSLITDGAIVRIEPQDGMHVHEAGVSTKLDCNTGMTIDERRGLFGVRAIGAPAIADGKSQIIGQASIKNPFTAPLSPYIDYSFNYIFDSNEGTLKYSLTIGAFPAFEAYVSINGSPPNAIIRRPATGNSPFSLYDMGLGFNTEQSTGTMKLRNPNAPNLNGLWSGVCDWPQYKAVPTTLTFSGNNYVYTIEYFSSASGSKDSVSLTIDKNTRRTAFTLFGYNYTGEFDQSYKRFVIRTSIVTCTYPH